jgi:hypothetical protein
MRATNRKRLESGQSTPTTPDTPTPPTASVSSSSPVSISNAPTTPDHRDQANLFAAPPATPRRRQRSCTTIPTPSTRAPTTTPSR